MGEEWSVGTGERNPAEESWFPKLGRVAEGGREDVRREDRLWLKGVEGALPRLMVCVCAVSRARADISWERRLVGEEGSNTLDTLVLPLYNTREPIRSSTRIMSRPLIGTASTAGIFLTAPKIILVAQSFATSIFTMARQGWEPEHKKQIMFCPTVSVERNTLLAFPPFSFICPPGSVHKWSRHIVTWRGLSSHSPLSSSSPALQGERVGEENLSPTLLEREGDWPPLRREPMLVEGEPDLDVTNIGE
jgi:hypothetical protein